MDNTASALCLSCHNMSSWALSSHAISHKPLPSALVAPLTTKNGAAQNKVVVKSPTVANAGCDSCHVSHAAGTGKELLRFSTPEQNCLPCHSTEGPGQNVAAEFNKNSVHPILQNVAAHNPQENPVNPASRHVTCVDCHNPHASSRAVGSQARISGALASVVGVGAGGSVLRTITREYELCYRCHGDSELRGPARVTRQFVETNTRREFNPGNTSFHPVEAAGKNSSVPSLIPPLATSSTMNCSDCHNNDQAPDAGGTGTKGPHGSAFTPILERMLLLTDGTAYNPANFALCYKCHSSSVVDSSQASSWPYHQKHIEEYRAAAGTGQTVRAAALAVQFLFALQWPPLHEVWVCLQLFSSQSATQHPSQNWNQEKHQPHKDIDAIVGNDSIEEFEHRLLQFECFNLHGLHDVLLMR
jgi:predicted CXXCH cytochrome family protein